MSLSKEAKKMHTKPEIKKKLEEAEEACENAIGDEQNRLSTVVITLRWVLGIKITQEPKDPVTEE
jgi:hypothetical protein